ncbi:hypothetical protein HMPREF9374_3447 [Desmospora sp. 8437]|nr:hypothetical protein HMPREF9374_3447 [Desmospora sp. 8437]
MGPSLLTIQVYKGFPENGQTDPVYSATQAEPLSYSVSGSKKKNGV